MMATKAAAVAVLISPMKNISEVAKEGFVDERIDLECQPEGARRRQDNLRPHARASP